MNSTPPPSETAPVEQDERAAQQNEPPELPPWYPPIALWQLYLLFVSTIGIYQLFWSWRFATDMRRHVDPKIRPWLYVVALCVPMAPPFLAWRMTGLLKRLDEMLAPRVGPPRMVIVGTAVITGIIGVAMTFTDIKDGTSYAIVLLLSVTVSPLPWMLLQRQLNHHKLSLTDPAWTSRPYRYTKLQYAALACGFPLIALMAFGISVHVDRRGGERLEVDARVSGTSGSYTLSVPDYGWARAKPGTLDAKADLELLGPTVETWAVVHTNKRDDLTMDQLVNAHRQMIDEEMISSSSDEIRVLRTDDLIPVSFTRYRNANTFDTDQTYWIAVLFTDDTIIEVIARTAEGPIIESDIERLVKSLSLVEKVEP